MALDAGLAGVVASPLEVAAMRAAFGVGPWIVVPGIRPLGEDADDQRRTADARSAAQAGASHLVVGRPITGSANPSLVYERLCDEAS
jgi:orotidine-5'-phosphate decarboxylase